MSARLDAPPTLLTFTISHFSEKVRWAFDASQVPYQERVLDPGPHVLTIRRVAPRSTVPVLISGKQVVQGSSEILDYAAESLGVEWLRFPASDAERLRELENVANRDFGRGVQTIAYEVLLGEPATVVELWYGHRRPWQRAAYSMLFPLLSPRVAAMYSIDPANVSRAKARLEKSWDDFERVLGSSEYFHGERPGRLDVTVASLLAPLCTPPEHIVKWPEAPQLREYVRRFEGRRLFHFVCDLYATFRQKPNPTERVELGTQREITP
jgi:glutathione S-transferase